MLFSLDIKCLVSEKKSLTNLLTKVALKFSSVSRNDDPLKGHIGVDKESLFPINFVLKHLLFH